MVICMQDGDVRFRCTSDPISTDSMTKTLVSKLCNLQKFPQKLADMSDA